MRVHLRTAAALSPQVNATLQAYGSETQRPIRYVAYGSEEVYDTNLGALGPLGADPAPATEYEEQAPATGGPQARSTGSQRNTASRASGSRTSRHS